MKQKKRWTVIDGFCQMSFDTEQEALEYCYKHNVSQSNIFVDER